MGKRSSLGPIDPQMGGLACYAIIQELAAARQDIIEYPQLAAYWQSRLTKYQPTVEYAARQAIEWSESFVKSWLTRNMFCNDPECEDKVNNIVRIFGDHTENKAHARHFSKQKCIDAGLVVESLEESQELQDAVLSAHHLYMLTFEIGPTYKLIENHQGAEYIERGQ